MGPSTKILVADDDLEILGLLTRHFRKLDVSLFEASDGEEALELAQRERPHLIVLDVMMPGMNGWEVCRAVRQDEDLRHTGVLMLTGIGENLNAMTSPLHGADDYLDKPFDLDELTSKARTIIEKRQT